MPPQFSHKITYHSSRSNNADFICIGKSYLYTLLLRRSLSGSTQQTKRTFLARNTQAIMKAADYTAVYTETIIRNGDNKIICDIRARQTVHSPLFFRKIVEIERSALRVAISHECQNHLGGGGGLGGSEKNRGTVITSLQLAFRRRDRNFTPFTIH